MDTEKEWNSEKTSKLTIILFAIYLLLLIGVILFKLPFYSPDFFAEERTINLIPFGGSFDEHGALLLRELLYNVLLYVPMGIYICMLKNEWSFVRKLYAIIGFSLAVEVIQYIFAMGRTDVTDLITNTLGGIIGIGISVILFKIIKKNTIKIINIVALVITICIVAHFLYLFCLSHFVMMAPPN